MKYNKEREIKNTEPGGDKTSFARLILSYINKTLIFFLQFYKYIFYI